MKSLMLMPVQPGVTVQRLDPRCWVPCWIPAPVHNPRSSYISPMLIDVSFPHSTGLSPTSALDRCCRPPVLFPDLNFVSFPNQMGLGLFSGMHITCLFLASKPHHPPDSDGARTVQRPQQLGVCGRRLPWVSGGRRPTLGSGFSEGRGG